MSLQVLFLKKQWVKGIGEARSSDYEGHKGDHVEENEAFGGGRKKRGNRVILQ